MDQIYRQEVMKKKNFPIYRDFRSRERWGSSVYPQMSLDYEIFIILVKTESHDRTQTSHSTNSTEHFDDDEWVTTSSV